MYTFTLPYTHTLPHTYTYTLNIFTHIQLLTQIHTHILIHIIALVVTGVPPSSLLLSPWFDDLLVLPKSFSPGSRPLFLG